MRRTVLRAVGTALLVAAGGCAHVEFAAPDDPVEEAQLRLSQITSAPGDAVCAADRVEQDFGLEALRHNRVESPPSDQRTRAWRESRAREMNLSQASAQLSQAWENGKAAAEAKRQGVPGAQVDALNAMYQFDALHGAVTAPAPARGSRPDRAEAAWASAQYATVWTEYFAASPDDEERGQILDWLTSRSLENIEVLRAYHTEFMEALKHGCG